MFKFYVIFFISVSSIFVGCSHIDEETNFDLVRMDMHPARMTGQSDEFPNHYWFNVSNGTDVAICYNALAYPHAGVYYYHDFELYDQNSSEFKSIGHSSVWRNEQMAFNVIYPGQSHDFLFDLNVAIERSSIEAGSHEYRFTFGYINCHDVDQWRGGDNPILLYQEFGRTSVLEGTIQIN